MPFNKVYLGTFHFFVSLNILCLIPHAVSAQNGWRMERFNPARANVTPTKGPQTQAQFSILASDVTERLWRISDGGDLIFSANDTVSCYSASGQLKWRKSIGGTVFDVAIGSDGTVYASSANSVIALNKDTGSPVWPNPVAANNGNESSPMAIGPDGTIYFLSGAGLVGYDPANVTAINPNGTIKFKTTADFGSGRGNTGLTMNNDASIMYIWSFPASLISLSGTTGNQIASSNSCRFHGVFQFTPFNTGYSFDGDSQLIEFGQSLSTCAPIPIGNSLLGVVAVAPSNNIILQLYTGSLTKEPLAAIDRQGRRIWTSTERYSSGIIIGNSSPFMDGNGTIFCIAPETNDVVAIDSDSGSVMWRSHFNDPISRLLLGGNGNLYVLANNKLYGSATTPSVTPLIFIPGNPGSRLDLDQVGPNSNLWPGPSDYSLLSLAPGQQRNIIATDVFRKSNITLIGDVYGSWLEMLTNPNRGGYREYRVDGNPTRRTSAGCDLSQRANNPNLFVFAYDWRKSNSVNAELLKDYVGCVKQFYPSSNVNIVTHSMGGLLARHYILRYPTDHNVEKLVTIAAPWLGAPKAIHVMETGEFFGKEFFNRFSINVARGTMKSLVEYFPSVHQLLPSSAYFALGGRPLKVENQVINDYDQFVLFMNKDFPFSRPGDTGRTFHSEPGQDNERINPLAVSYYHFYGVQQVRETIGQVQARTTKIVCQDGRCTSYVKYDVTPTDGDGTVPRLSAERRGIGPGLDLNAEGATVRLFSDADKKLVEHTGILKNTIVQNATLGALRDSQQSLGQALMSAQLLEGSDEVLTQPAYYLRFNGPVNLTITDASGNNTKPLNDPSDDGLPNATSYALGDRSALVIMPLDQVYTATFRSDTNPIEIEVTKEADQPSQAIRYTDLALPVGVLATIKFTPQGVEELRYDSNGDGTFETMVGPTVSVSGAAAQDTEPPVVMIVENRQSQNLTIVTVSATDSGSGVKKINYSLDGTNYKAYSAPFSVDPYRVRKIYAFADDNVANRSGLVEFQITAPPPVVMVEQGTTNRAVALDSVTWLRAPFPVLNNYNFSADHRSRVILFISGLLLTQGDGSIVTVTAAGITLPVEHVGTVAAVTGLNASYIVVRLPDGLPGGELPLTIAVGGVVNTNSVTLGISP